MATEEVSIVAEVAVVRRDTTEVVSTVSVVTVALLVTLGGVAVLIIAGTVLVVAIAGAVPIVLIKVVQGLIIAVVVVGLIIISGAATAAIATAGGVVFIVKRYMLYIVTQHEINAAK